MRCEERCRDARRIAERHIEKGAAREPHEVAVALFALSEKNDVCALRNALANCRASRLLEAHRELDSRDGLDTHSGQLLGEIECAEQIVGVGQRQRRLLVGGGELRDVCDLERTFEQRIGRVHVQMDEADFSKISASSPRYSRLPRRTPRSLHPAGADSELASASVSARPVDIGSRQWTEDQRPHPDSRPEHGERGDLGGGGEGYAQHRELHVPVMFIIVRCLFRVNAGIGSNAIGVNAELARHSAGRESARLGRRVRALNSLSSQLLPRSMNSQRRIVCGSPLAAGADPPEKRRVRL